MLEHGPEGIEGPLHPDRRTADREHHGDVGHGPGPGLGWRHRLRPAIRPPSGRAAPGLPRPRARGAPSTSLATSRAPASVSRSSRNGWPPDQHPPAVDRPGFRVELHGPPRRRPGTHDEIRRESLPATTVRLGRLRPYVAAHDSPARMWEVVTRLDSLAPRRTMTAGHPVAASLRPLVTRSCRRRPGAPLR